MRTANDDFHHLGERYARSGAFIKVAVDRSALLAAAEGNLLTAELLLRRAQRRFARDSLQAMRAAVAAAP